MYTKRDQFVIPFDLYLFGNLVTTKANFSPAKLSKNAKLNTAKYNATQHKFGYPVFIYSVVQFWSKVPASSRLV